MKPLIAKKVREQKLGVTCRLNDKYKVYNKSIRVVKENGEPLAIFLKKHLTDPGLLQAGRDLVKFKKSSTQRGMAAGYDKKKEGRYGGTIGTANAVDSSIVGFTDPSGFYQCRQTVLHKQHEKDFQSGGSTIKLLNYVSKTFKEFAPAQYRKQESFIRKINQNMRLGKTVFSTITVNVDFRTRAHKDAGDFESGLGNLVVFKLDNYSGGELLLPEYNLAFHIEEGDILFFDTHEVHCNNPIKGKGRLSLVCYARKHILDKCQGLTKAQLAANSTNPYAKKKN